MGKLIATFGCAGLVAVSVWFIHDAEAVRTAAAAEDARAGSASGAPVSASHALARAREHYRQGRYDEALNALQAARRNPGSLSWSERRQAESLLQQVRRETGGSDHGIQQVSGRVPANSTGENNPYKPVAKRLLNEARRLAAKGDTQGALRLVRRARAFPVRWSPNEQSPDDLLRRLQPRQQRTAPTSTPTGSAQGASLPAGIRPPSDPTQDGSSPPLRETTANGSGSPNGQPGFGSAVSGGPLDELDLPPRERRKKSRAQELLRQARRDLDAGRLEEARQKALRARQADVVFGLFDDRPELVLAEIERRQQRDGRLAESGGSGASGAQQASGREQKQQAESSVSNFDDEFASDDPFVHIQASAESQSRSGNSEDATADSLPSEGDASPDVEEPPAKRQARQLLKQARAALDAGRLQQAREKALQARKMDVAWSLFEQRPQQLLAEIDRMTDSSGAGATTASAGGDASSPAGTDANDSPKKQAATELVQQAQADLKKGRYAQARRKALEAQDLGVTWSLFETRPAHILAEVERQSGSLVISPDRSAQEKTASPGSQDFPFPDRAAQLAQNESPSTGAGGDPSPGSADPAESADAAEAPQPESPEHKQAMALLREARRNLRAGRLDQAREKARQAEQLDVTYGLFDDRPDLVLQDIRRFSSTDAVARAETDSGGDSPSNATSGSQTPSDQTGAKDRARSLLRQARLDLKHGRVDAAREKALQARELDVSYGVFDDRPDLVLAEVNRASRSGGRTSSGERPESARRRETQQASSQESRSQGAGPPSLNPGDLRTADAEQDSTAPSFQPPETAGRASASADELYQQGVRHLQQGNRTAAYRAFRRADRSAEQLDPHRRQQLQDFLAELAPRQNGQGVQLAGNQNSDAGPLSELEQQQSIRFQRLRSETLNAIYRAERLREKNPDEALATVKRAIESVKNSELPPETARVLLTRLERTQTSIQTYRKHKEPQLAQQRRNEEVMARIEADQRFELRIEQEYADLVEKFNQYLNEGRYAEALLVAQEAKELNPENPTGEVMLYKARYARRAQSNEDLRLAKDEALWTTLNDVEESAVPNVGDENPLVFGDLKEWKRLSDRRSRYGEPGENDLSEKERRIQKSLSRSVSLSFQNAPLHEVVQRISNLANVDVVLDPIGIEEEAVTSNTQVSIDVRDVRLESALNLILEPLRLGYMIEDDVLKITSQMRQQGELKPRTYNVADLVTPIPSVSGRGGRSAFGAPSVFGGANMSVPAMGGPQAAGGQAFAQVGGGQPQMNNGNLGPVMSPWGGSPTMEAQLGGGAPAADFDSLTDLIVTTVAPDSWAEVGGQGTLESFDMTLSLVIRQTQQVHEEIADLLQQLRRLQDLQVTVEVRLITVSDTFFEQIGIDFDFNVQDNVNADTTLLPEFGFPSGDDDGATTFESPALNLPTLDDWPKQGTIVGMADQNANVTDDLDIRFRQGSFDVGVPQFGNFNPQAGIQFGMAILNDIETFMFVRAAQSDQRSNLMFAPKVTLFNGQTAFVADFVQRPFVISVQPTVGFASVGFAPVIALVPDGIFMSVQAVISADRRFVRLTVQPNFTNITDVETFTIAGGAAGGIGGGGAGIGGGFGGGGGGGGFGGGGGLVGVGGIGGGRAAQAALGLTLGGQQDGQDGQDGGDGDGQDGGAAGTITVQQPIVETVTVVTTVSVPDGGTVLLGGVKRLREGRNMAGVPILNKIPYISRLFKNTGVGRETESLMLMVTPRIIINEEEEALLLGEEP